MEDTVVAYSMSRSVVRITGQVTNTEDPLLGTTTRTAEAVTELLSVPDLVYGNWELRIPGKAHADTSSTIVLRDDRRLASIEASFTGRGPKTLKAVAATLGVIAGGVLSFVAPPIGLPLLGGSLALLPKLARIMPGDIEIQEDPRFVAWKAKFQEDGNKLARYRIAMADLTEQHAAAADSSADDSLATLESLSKKLALIRSEAGIYEAKFTSWCLDQIKTTEQPIEVSDFGIDELPTEQELKTRLNTENLDLPARHLSVEAPRWVVTARRYGIAVSVDNVIARRAQESIGQGEIQIGYRPGADVILRVWKVTLVEGAEEKPIDISEIKDSSFYVAKLIETKPARVVRSSTEFVAIALDVEAFRSGKLSVTFNDLGEPSEIGGDASSQVAEAVAGIGDNLKTSLETGSAIAAAVVPGSATAKYLERQVAIAKSRKELASPTAEAEAVANLQASVEVAELEARLRLARLNSLRTSATIMYTVGN